MGSLHIIGWEVIGWTMGGTNCFIFGSEGLEELVPELFSIFGAKFDIFGWFTNWSKLMSVGFDKFIFLLFINEIGCSTKIIHLTSN